MSSNMTTGLPGVPMSPNLGTETKGNVGVHFLVYRLGGRNYFGLLMGLTAIGGQWTADVQVPGLGRFNPVTFGSGEGQCRTMTETDLQQAMAPFGFEPMQIPGFGG